MAAERDAPRIDGGALAQACASLKIFPLPGVVVLPGTPTPFRVFEPRYRALVADALAGDRILAVPTLVSDEDDGEDAAIHPVAGACAIEAVEAHPDGTYELLVRGLARVRLERERPRAKPYREFEARVLEDVYPAGGAAALEPELEALGQLVYDLAGLLPPESGAGQLAEAVAQLRDPSRTADLVAAAALSEPEARLRVLEELDVARRVALVVEEVAGVVLILSQGKNPRA